MLPFVPDFRARLLALRSGSRGRSRAEDGRPGYREGRAAFKDHRAYSAGDDVRFLDWNVFLRTGELAVKTFSDDAAPEARVILDRSASAGPEGSTQDRTARELAAAAGFPALVAGGTARLFALGPDGLRPVVVAVGRKDADRWLQAVEGLGAPAGAADWRAIEASPPPRTPGLRAVFVSDFLAESVPVRALAVHATAARPFAFIVAAHRSEPAAEGRRVVTMADPETGARLETAEDSRWREAYAEARAAHVAAMLDACRRRGIAAVAASGREPFETLLAEVRATAP